MPTTSANTTLLSHRGIGKLDAVITPRILFLLVALSLISIAIPAEPHLIVRRAKGVEIIYLLPFVALWQCEQPKDDIPKLRYHLAISRWLNEPELAGQTGDTSMETLVNAVATLGIEHAKGVLYGQGHTPNSHDWPDTERFFVVTADRAYFFRKRNDWLDFLHERCGITKPKPVDVGPLFQTLSKRANHALPRTRP